MVIKHVSTAIPLPPPGMENLMALTQLLSSGSTEGGLDGPSTLLLGVFVTLLPKVSCSLTTFPDTCPISRWFPACFPSSWPTSQLKTISSSHKFVENLLMVDNIVVASEDNSLERMSQDYTGFKKFLFGSLEALDINVSDYIGEIKYK